MNYDTRFTFGHMPAARSKHLEKKETKELLTKWSMEDGIKVQAFYFDSKFKIYLLDDFVRDFFGSTHVMQNLLHATTNQQFVPIDIQAESVQFQKVRSTLTTTEIFDRLTAEGSKVARTSGAIIKCLPDFIQPEQDIHDACYPIEIGDQLRKMLLQDYCKSDDWIEPMNVFNEEEKDEFLFRLFSHFAIGGSLCQYEDYILPYIDTAKLVYKDLMSISKPKAEVQPQGLPISDSDNSSRNLGTEIDTGSENEEKGQGPKLVVSSTVVKVNSVKNDQYTVNDLLFTNRHVNNFFYLIIQPEDQTVFTFYHQVV